MSWTLLPTNYTDAVWDGLRKYTEVNNSDGTVSFRDVTTYTQKENSFFGARDANRMNEALNYIMSKLENGTNLYEEFTTYFATQKTLFENKATDVVNNTKSVANKQNDDFKTYLAGKKTETDSSLKTLETNYQSRINTFENTSKSLFNTWFEGVKNQLSTDAAGKLQIQINDLLARTVDLEDMIVRNDFRTTLLVDNSTVLTDDSGNNILANWKVQEV